MSLLFVEGFGGGDIATKWNPNGSTFTAATSTRCPGSYMASCSSGSGSSIKKSFTASNQVYVGVAFQFSGSTNTASQVFYFYGDNGVTQHVTVMRNANSNLLEIRRGGTGGTLLATGTTLLYINTWYYIEFSVVVSGTVGSVEVRLNGNTTPEVSFSGNTKNGGTNSTVDAFVIGFTAPGGTSLLSLADLYIANSLGSINNNFLGDICVRTISPNGNGTFSQLTNSAGNSVNNFSYVNEHPYSSANYTGSNTIGLRDTYSMSDLPAAVSTVFGVQVAGIVGKSDAALVSSKYVLRSGGTNYYGATHALTTTQLSYYDLFEIDPATGIQWTTTGVNNVESGVETA